MDNPNPECKLFLTKFRSVVKTIKKYNAIALLIVLCVTLLLFEQTRVLAFVTILPMLILMMYALAIGKLTHKGTKFSDASIILVATIDGLLLYLSYFAFGDALFRIAINMLRLFMSFIGLGELDILTSSFLSEFFPSLALIIHFIVAVLSFSALAILMFIFFREIITTEKIRKVLFFALWLVGLVLFYPLWIIFEIVIFR